MRKLLRVTILVLLAALAPSGGVALAADSADAVVVEAKRLIDARNARAAYDLLKPLEVERAGDPRFDYLLGIAALDSGRATEAIFALERVLDAEPRHPQARAEIARAYFVLGETGTARSEFETVKSQQVPPEVAATIDRFLDALDRIADAKRTRVTAYVEATIGYDTNVNSGPGTGQVALPVFGGVIATLDPGAQQKRDQFGAVTGGFGLHHPLTKDVAFIGGLNLNMRLNRDEHQFDTGFWDGFAGLAWTRERDVFTAAVQGNTFYVDDHRFREAYGLIGQWQRNLDRRNQVSVYGQFTRLRFADRAGVENSIRDADRKLVGLGYAHAFRRPGEPGFVVDAEERGDEQRTFRGEGPIVFVGVFGGQEDERVNTRPDLGHRFFGLRAGGQYRINPRLDVFVNGNAERRKYGGEDAVFLVTRRDRFYTAALGVTYVPARMWKITPQITAIRNKSNLEITDYRREIYSVTLRRDF